MEENGIKKQSRSVRQILTEQQRFLQTFRESIERRRQFLLEPIIHSRANHRLFGTSNGTTRRLRSTEIVVSSHLVNNYDQHQQHSLGATPSQPQKLDQVVVIAPAPSSTNHTPVPQATDINRNQDKETALGILLTPNTKNRIEHWLDSLTL